MVYKLKYLQCTAVSMVPLIYVNFSKYTFIHPDNSAQISMDGASLPITFDLMRQVYDICFSLAQPDKLPTTVGDSVRGTLPVTVSENVFNYVCDAVNDRFSLFAPMQYTSFAAWVANDMCNGLKHDVLRMFYANMLADYDPVLSKNILVFSKTRVWGMKLVIPGSGLYGVTVDYSNKRDTSADYKFPLKVFSIPGRLVGMQQMAVQPMKKVKPPKCKKWYWLETVHEVRSLVDIHDIGDIPDFLQLDKHFESKLLIQLPYGMENNSSSLTSMQYNFYVASKNGKVIATLQQHKKKTETLGYYAFVAQCTHASYTGGYVTIEDYPRTSETPETVTPYDTLDVYGDCVRIITTMCANDSWQIACVRLGAPVEDEFAAKVHSLKLRQDTIVQDQDLYSLKKTYGLYKSDVLPLCFAELTTKGLRTRCMLSPRGVLDTFSAFIGFQVDGIGNRTSPYKRGRKSELDFKRNWAAREICDVGGILKVYEHKASPMEYTVNIFISDTHSTTFSVNKPSQ
jgi:hypothetical protein